jgi:anti-sigma factor RsiW
MGLSPICERVRFQASLELDGELSQFERAMLTAHVARCEACRAYQDDLLALTRHMRTTPLELLTSPIVLPRRRRAVARPLQFAALAAVVVATAGSAAGLLESDLSTPPQRPARPAYLDSVSYEMHLIRQANQQRFFEQFRNAE